MAMPGSTNAVSPSPPTAAIDPLLEIHPGFRTSRTVVLHKFGTDPNYDSWRSQSLRPSGARNSVGVSGITLVTNLMPVPLGQVTRDGKTSIVTSEPAPNITFLQTVARAQDVQALKAELELKLSSNVRRVNSTGNGRVEARIAEIRSSVLESNPALRHGVLPVGQFTIARRNETRRRYSASG